MILVLCQRGNVRSVTVACILKDLCMQHDVLPTGTQTTSDTVLSLLSGLADKILICGNVPSIQQGWMEWFGDKVVHLDIGDDTYGRAMHPELVHKCLAELAAKTDYLKGQLRWPVEMYEQMNAAVHSRVVEYTP